ncbi:MAG TPA: serine hydrolase, partial [Anaeromyxobacteraceae bacterium]|nr:serine hydrolase [Anaeromyxobacteraceae bacterium]
MRRRPVAGLLLLAAWSAAIFAAGWQARARLGRPGPEARDRRVRQGGTRLVSPLLDVELPEGFGVEREPIPFKYKVERLVAERTSAGRVRAMSVYWRDLMDGPWFGIGLKRKYNPASMMKVPVMMAWLKRAERDPGQLRRTFV